MKIYWSQQDVLQTVHAFSESNFSISDRENHELAIMLFVYIVHGKHLNTILTWCTSMRGEDEKNIVLPIQIIADLLHTQTDPWRM
jgi:hypothetical protein